MNTKQSNIARFNTIASEWDEDPKRVRMGQQIAQAMRSALNPTGAEHALEFGAGTGLVTLPMVSGFARVTAMDASSGMLAILRKKCEHEHLGHVDIIEGTVPDMLPDGPFDLVYSSMTMHHVEDVPELLKQLFDRIKPGGRAALADLDAEDGNFHSDVQGVVHHGFAREQFGDWLRTAGFTDVQFSTAYTIQRDGDDGSRRDYPIFLAVAHKPSL